MVVRISDERAMLIIQELQEQLEKQKAYYEEKLAEAEKAAKAKNAKNSAAKLEKARNRIEVLQADGKALRKEVKRLNNAIKCMEAKHEVLLDKYMNTCYRLEFRMNKELCDRDGKRICVGDIVWGGNGEQFRVRTLHALNSHPINCSDKDDNWRPLKPEWCTHYDPTEPHEEG